MFFIMGISQGQKKLNFVQTNVCARCGQFGRLELFMTYTYLSLFFIPVFRWNTKYLLNSTCCSTVYSIDKELGKKLHKGELLKVTDTDLHVIHAGHSHSNYKCPNCGYEVNSEFVYCPKCAKQL